VPQKRRPALAPFLLDALTEHREEQCAAFKTEPEAVAHIVAQAHGGLRFHDLRHCYATWLVPTGSRSTPSSTSWGTNSRRPRSALHARADGLLRPDQASASAAC